MHELAQAAVRRTVDAVIRGVDRASASSGEPFDEPGIMVPHLRSARYGWTHYGVMIPDLPEPHRFLSVMSLIGATGTVAFDNDHALVDRPRRNASVVVGTAASYPAHFGNYSTARDFVSRPDGSLVKFGDDVTIAGSYPRYRLTGRFGGVEMDLELDNTDKVTWFVRNPLYKHLSLLTEYRGWLATSAGRTDVSGLSAFEYGACPSPYQLLPGPLPRALKLPLDSFLYQIVNLGDEQVLLGHHCVGGTPIISHALLRGRNRYSSDLGDAEFRVERYRDTPEDTPYGIPMPVPAATRFTVRDGDDIVLDVLAEMDTTFTFGLGSGFVTGFRHTSTLRGEGFTGRGYMEYIDRRPDAGAQNRANC